MSNVSNSQPSMLELLEAEDAPSWSPYKDPDHDRDVVGTVLDRGTFHGDHGDSAVITIDRGHDGAGCKPPGRFVKWFAFGAVADGEIERTNPRPNDEIGIRFRGTGKVAKGANAGKPYPLWSVAVRRAAGNGRAPVSDIPTTENTGGGYAVPGDDLPFAVLG